MSAKLLDHLDSELARLKEEGLYKAERLITSQQQAEIDVAPGGRVINFCANNYLGLANHPEVMEAAKQGIDRYGFGVASVRFICGTQDLHRHLETRLSEFLGTEETVLYTSCFDANTGLFEALLGPDDAVLSDELNHASIIDGIRLCKARRFRYANNDMADLKAKLEQARDARFRLIATDGVFSMDGVVANLAAICELADEYDALVMVDDSHAVGFMGAQGRGTPEHWGVIERVDIVTGTLGKALGGATGGYASGRRQVMEWLRQASRPYLFSNSVAPPIVAASLRVLEMIEAGQELRDRIEENSAYFRNQMEQAGFRLAGAGHPIIPVMIGDATLASKMAERLLERGIYVIGFSYPVVPRGQARIRTQMSALHTHEQLDRAASAFREVGQELGVVS